MGSQKMCGGSYINKCSRVQKIYSFIPQIYENKKYKEMGTNTKKKTNGLANAG
jgi:hypothetical protein